MAKRFTDTDKYKKPFIRSLPGAYKLFWDYLYHECDHAGIWIVDFEIAQIYLGQDMQVDREKALRLFNENETRVIEFSDGKKWFIKAFIDFQYGELNPENRVHKSVINILKKENLYKENKGFVSPLQGVKDKNKDKDLDKDKDKDSENPKNKFPDLEQIQELAEMRGLTPVNEVSENYFNLRGRDNWMRSDRKGNMIPIGNWQKDMSLLYQKGALYSEKSKNKSYEKGTIEHGQSVSDRVDQFYPD